MSRMRGTRSMRKRVRRMPDALQDAALDEIRETVETVHREGRANIDAMVTRRTGKLRRLYSKGVSVAKGAGSVGYRTKNARNKAFYARFVHDGTSETTAKPFHDQAVEAVEQSHSQRMKAAARKVGKAGAPGTLGRTGGQGER